MADLIDRELRRALAVSPSPEFVARVRTTIAEAPRPSMMPGMLRYAAAIACIAAVVVAVGVRDRAGLKPSTTYITPSTTSVASSTTNVLSSNAYSPLATTPFQRHSVVVVPTFRSASTRVAVKEAPLAEVLIAPEDTAALQQLVRHAHEYVVSFDTAPIASAWVMNDLTVSPITIEPLESAPAHNN